MGFNNVGDVFTLAPQEVVRWQYSFTLGDAGAQFAAPDLRAGGGILTAFNQAKHKTPNGRVGYSVDIRNDGSTVNGHNLQGGGLAFGFNNFLDVVTLAPGHPFKAQFRFGSGENFPNDQGARFISADIKSVDCDVVALLQGKEFVSTQGFRYSALYHNNGPATAAFNYQGGGFSPGFNRLGDVVTIAPKETQLYRFFFRLGHDDHGAQYAGADVLTHNAELVAVSHGKQRVQNNGVDYFVTIRNESQIAAAYNLQGGSLI
jgi:hypothetical protein